MTRVKQADNETRTAKLAREAADKRYDYVVAYRKWLQRLVRYTQHNAFWKEAQYELAQAKTAQANNIQPQGFVLSHYVDQEAQRARGTTAARDRARRDKDDVMAARTRWRAIQNQADKLLGKTSEYPDPMATDKASKGGDDRTGYTVGDGGSRASDREVQPVQDPAMKSNDDGDQGDDAGDDDKDDEQQ
jgi:hypothetical protein